MVFNKIKPQKAKRGQPARPTFGELIKSTREGRKLTLREVEEKTGVSNPQICLWESGRSRSPNIKNLIPLVEFFELDWNEVVASLKVTLEIHDKETGQKAEAVTAE
jgi:transcriptional regulator with XRE-family HTH domain